MSNRHVLGGGSSSKGEPFSGLERLEARELLAGDGLPTGGVWLPWGEGQVAAARGSYIMQFDGMYDTAQSELMAREVATRLGIRVTDVDVLARGRYATIQTNDQIRLDAVQALVARMPFLRSVEPDRLQRTARTPNDTEFSNQWGLNNIGQFVEGLGFGLEGADIGAVEAWDTTIGTRDNIVAVIDTGIDVTHPDLIPNLWVNPGEVAGNGIDDDGNGFVDDINGWDFGENDANPQDEEGHGTAVAGTIGAAGNNNLGVTGVNWNVSLMGLKIADRNGSLVTSAIVAAHDYATMMIGRGLNIVASNNSYGGFDSAFYTDAPEGFDVERDAIQRFIDAGATFVAAAGNDAFNNDDPDVRAFPASYNIPGLISVAATDNNDQLAGFSNYGAQTVELGAPGTAIRTTAVGGGYTYIDGTSFASPMVAGAVALLKTVKPNASAVEIREALFNSVDPLPSLQGRVRSGGRLNVARAIEVIQIDGPVVRSVTPGPVTTQLVPGTTQPLNSAVFQFSKDIDSAFLSTSQVTLVGDGVDNLFGTGDDVSVPISSVVRSVPDPRLVTVGLTLTGFPQQRLPIDTYRMTLQPGGFRDISGNFLNGNSTGGTAHVHEFRVVGTTGDNEPNDATGEATVLSFDATGAARFTGVTVGNGLFGNLDVDLYRLDLSRGGQISAEITAQRLAGGSSLDSYLRLFGFENGQLVELANNDQFFGQDSFLDFFVRTQGTYYIGVSGFGNDRYNPEVAGSGNQQSTGVYNLTVNVRLATDDVVSIPFFNPGNLPPGTDPFLGGTAPEGPTTLIPPNAPNQTQGITAAFIDITDSRQILDLNVRVRLTHTYVGDLVMSLIAPDGTEVVLSNRRGAPGQDFTNTLFDDEATTSVSAGVAPFSGAFRAESSLGAFDGDSAAGRWTLRINDASALNTGRLENWALDITFQNNIFGPFESNDTLSTARALGVNGSGTAQINAFIGDGGFGVQDRDIFSFTAVAGASLTAAVTPAGVLDSAIRIFDVTGAQIFVANPGGTGTSRVDSYVFATAGTYYIAISESNNVTYTPILVGDPTSRPSLTTGNYTLAFSLAAGVSDPEQTIAGSAVAAGVNTNGYLGAGSGTSYTGVRFNGVEFLPVDSANDRPQTFFGGTFGGQGFSNGTPDRPNAVAFSVTNESDPVNRRVVTKSEYRGLRIERSYQFSQVDNFVVVDVFLTNTTSTPMTSVSWMEGMNPDPGTALGEDNRQTFNDILPNGKYVQARYVNNQFGQGLTIAMAGADSDPRVQALTLNANVTPRDPGVLVGQPIVDPNDSLADQQLVLLYNLGNLASGGATNLRYFIFMGSTPANAQAMYTTLNAGTGTGHLTPNSFTPATETLSDSSTVAQLPYRVYYPEGNSNSGISEFLPLSNPNSQPVRVVVIARYEFGQRDQVLKTLTINPNSRSGITLSTADVGSGSTTILNRPGVPYALEIRSDKPIAATSSHYDLNLLTQPSGVGESFTSQTSTAWSFGQVAREANINDFIVWYNPNDRAGKVTATFYREDGTAAYFRTYDISAFRRGGIDVGGVSDVKLVNGPATQTPFALPEGRYGVVVTSDIPIVAAQSHYDRNDTVAEGVIGGQGGGATSGIVPEGQYGLNGTAETLGVLNTNSAAANVVFTFLYDNGSSYRTTLTVAPRSNGTLDVSTLANFPTGRAYSIFYSSDVAVTVNARSNAFGQQLASATATQAYTWWSFGEGFRPGDNTAHPGVVEHLRLYNPSSTAVTFELTIAYDGIPRGFETFRRTIPARSVVELSMDQFVTGGRRATDQYYATTIKAPSPIVAWMTHYDSAFPGGFGALGTPLGRTSVIS